MLIKICIFAFLVLSLFIAIYNFGKKAMEIKILKNNNNLKKKYNDKKIHNSGDLSNILQVGKY